MDMGKRDGLSRKRGCRVARYALRGDLLVMLEVECLG
jgi:hypothetical protein